MSISGTVHRGEHTADFEVLDKMLTVTSVFGKKQTQLNKTPPEILAGILLAEQIIEAKRNEAKRLRETPRANQSRPSE